MPKDCRYKRLLAFPKLKTNQILFSLTVPAVPYVGTLRAQAEGRAPEHTINLTIKRGVRSALEYAASGDIEKARALTNPDVAPHLEFVDMAGHGYTVITAGPNTIDTEFVCIVRPIAHADTPDGGPLRYRVSHRARMWQPGTSPKLEQRMLEGNARLPV